MMVTGDGSSDPWREHGSEKGDAAAMGDDTLNHLDRKQDSQLPIPNNDSAGGRTEDQTDHPMQTKKWRNIKSASSHRKVDKAKRRVYHSRHSAETRDSA